jgi:hypothetical protein
METPIMPTPKRRIVLVRPPCDWCSGPYQYRPAQLETGLTIGGDARAVLCDQCAAMIGRGARSELVPVADTLDLITPGEAWAYLGSEFWTHARTVPEDPHDYLLLQVSHDPLMHLRVIRFIRETGDRRQWPRDKRWYSYWRSGGYEHWTMPRESDPIINRRVVTP